MFMILSIGSVLGEMACRKRGPAMVEVVMSVDSSKTLAKPRIGAVVLVFPELLYVRPAPLACPAASNGGLVKRGPRRASFPHLPQLGSPTTTGQGCLSCQLLILRWCGSDRLMSCWSAMNESTARAKQG